MIKVNAWTPLGTYLQIHILGIIWGPHYCTFNTFIETKHKVTITTPLLKNGALLRITKSTSRSYLSNPRICSLTNSQTKKKSCILSWYHCHGREGDSHSKEHFGGLLHDLWYHQGQCMDTLRYLSADSYLGHYLRASLLHFQYFYWNKA